MSNKLRTLAATGIAGAVLGAGIGMAAAGDEPDAGPPATAPSGAYESMDAMHAAMRDQMPEDLAAQCDAMHAAMPESMRSASPRSMGWTGSMMGDGWSPEQMTSQHEAHHG